MQEEYRHQLYPSCVQQGSNRTQQLNTVVFRAMFIVKELLLSKVRASMEQLLENPSEKENSKTSLEGHPQSKNLLHSIKQIIVMWSH